MPYLRVRFRSDFMFTGKDHSPHARPHDKTTTLLLFKYIPLDH